MSKITPREHKTAWFSITFFLFGCALTIVLMSTVGLHFTRHYFVAHFLFGLFFPFVGYAMGGTRVSFWIGITLTAVWHYGNELWEDQLDRAVANYDWDHIVAGTLGMVAAWWCYRAWNRYLDARDQRASRA